MWLLWPLETCALSSMKKTSETGTSCLCVLFFPFLWPKYISTPQVIKYGNGDIFNFKLAPQSTGVWFLILPVLHAFQVGTGQRPRPLHLFHRLSSTLFLLAQIDHRWVVLTSARLTQKCQRYQLSGRLVLQQLAHQLALLISHSFNNKS